MKKPGEPVRLRSRKMPSGNTSLYLDIYVDGRRRYEYLKLYLVPEKGRKEREANRETLRLAEAVRAKRLVEVRDGRYGFAPAKRRDVRLLDYYRRMCEERRGAGGSQGNWGNWWSALRHLERYCREDTTLAEVTAEWVKGFRDYLDRTAKVRDRRRLRETADDLKPLSQSSKQSYFNKVRACLNRAFNEGLMERNPLAGVQGFGSPETERVYLTLEEVRAMAATECRCPALKRAFLFSCLTGIRKSDIEKMRWSEVRQEGGFTRVTFRQKKTGGLEYLDISPEAVRWMGERGGGDSPVFRGFCYTSAVNEDLREWARRSGVDKHITFHSGRHTFALLMLDLGADIYTLQKLLGHRMVSTTAVYAHILDRKKREAVSRIPGILPDGGKTE